MGRKNKKHKKKYYNYNYTNYNTPSKKSFVTSKDIEDIAFKVFGSTYYTPEI